jgi:hypothetical protein
VDRRVTGEDDGRPAGWGTLGDVAIDDPPLPAPPGFDAEIDRQWAFLAAPGAALTGEQRVGAAAVARAARRDGTDATEPHLRAARRISAEPHAITADWIAALAEDGLTVHAYVEVLGVVARTAAIDTAVRGLNAPARDLPEPVAGHPDGAIDGAASTRSAWVPTAGAANPVTVLSSVPAEAAHQERLHDVLYMSYGQMSDMDIDLDLHRTQIELVAARTSSVNECVY